MSIITGPLRSVELATKVSRALHQLLVLLLLHFQLSLSLDADGVHITSSTGCVRLQLSLCHAFQEASWLLVVDDSWAVRNNSNLTVRLGGFFNGEHCLVDSVMRRWFESFGFSHQALCVRSRLSLRQRWRAERQEVARHGINLEVDAGLASIGVSQLDLVHTVTHPLVFVATNGQLRHRAIQLVDRARQRRHGIRNLVSFSSWRKNGGEVLVADGSGHRLCDGDGAM